MSDLLIILYLFFEISAIVVCLHDLYGERLRVDAWTVGLIVVDVLALYAMEKTGVGNEYSFVIFSLVVLYSFLHFDKAVDKLIVNVSLCLITIFVLQFISAILVSVLINSDEFYIRIYLLINLITFLFCVIVKKFKVLSNISKVFLNHNSIIFISLVFDLVVLLKCIIEVKNSKKLLVEIVAFFVIIILIILIMSIKLGQTAIKNKELKTSIKLQEMYNDSFKSLITAIRTKQHEFDNHINAILGMCFTYKKIEDLVAEQKKYCRKIAEESKFNKLLLMNNYTLAGFLYSKFSNISEKITLSLAIQCNNVDCDVPTYKLIEILGNLIDNASEALIEKYEGDTLYFSLFENSNSIICSVKNRSDYVKYDKLQSYFQKGVSTKGANRGYGLYNVKEICDEYKIDLICENILENNANYFSVKIIIKKRCPGLNLGHLNSY